MTPPCKSSECANNSITNSEYCLNCIAEQSSVFGTRYPYVTRNRQTVATNDTNVRPDLSEEGAKDDSDKVDLTLITEDMPRALIEIAKVSMFGLSKGYSRGGWLSVPNGIRRYKAAQMRHGLKPSMGEEHDLESKLSHLAHEAWNAMAKLELYLRSQENK